MIDVLDYSVKIIEVIRNYFLSKNIACNITPNLPAESCRDAAQKRSRLGNIGIPLCDELKSNFGYFTDTEGKKQYVLLHCRGNQLLDEAKVNELLGHPFCRLPEGELQEVFGLQYGIVNPLISIQHEDILQVFDEATQQDLLPPYTMMTNAGHFEWGMEFRPKELLNALPNTQVADITSDAAYIHFQAPKIGILTGNSPESGIMLWQTINQAIREKLGEHFLGDISFPPVFIESLPEMGLSMELDQRNTATWQTVEAGVKSLLNRGANLIAIACNTTQYFSPQLEQLCAQHGAQYVSMSQAIHQRLSAQQVKEFDFIGISYVTDFGNWSGFDQLAQQFDIKVPDPADLQAIHELAFEVKKKAVSGKGINKLRDLINEATNTNTIVIALTEISFLLASQKKKKSEKTYFDTLTILGEELAKRHWQRVKNLLA